jgi:peroxiredoxin Q/BCP
MLEEGNKAPLFTLKDQNDREISLEGFRGKTVVLYFYPRDNTPGCTKEACSFRDAYDEILAQGAVVIGISRDKTSSHEKFARRHNLPFHLLSDPEGSIIESFGAWKEKSMYGRTFMGIIRCTYIIDPAGIIKKVYPRVKPDQHGREIIEYLKSI